jgi:hypothetical protein
MLKLLNEKPCYDLDIDGSIHRRREKGMLSFANMQ